MFRTLSRFGKIRIRILQHGVLIAMPELFLQSDVSWNLVILDFGGALRCILIVRAIWHHQTSYDKFPLRQV
jgi:hypothetical protein